MVGHVFSSALILSCVPIIVLKWSFKTLFSSSEMHRFMYQHKHYNTIQKFTFGQE